jgi:predicted Rossmann fold nucleotide-binding protein DprA/Smf involved in DNA uptake
MKLAIVGTRTFTDYEFLCWEVNKFSNITEIISGGAKGADKLAEQYAKEHKIPLSIYPADWNKYGNSAGPIRNKTIVENADEIIAFWDGESPGTKSTIELAKKYNKKYKIINYNDVIEYRGDKK